MKPGSLNSISVEGQVAQFLADSFDDEVEARLSTITVEEMFYLLQVLRYEPQEGRKVDVFQRVIQKRAQGWLRGQFKTPGLPWELLRSKWQEEFYEFLALGAE